MLASRTDLIPTHLPAFGQVLGVMLVPLGASLCIRGFCPSRFPLDLDLQDLSACGRANTVEAALGGGKVAVPGWTAGQWHVAGASEAKTLGEDSFSVPSGVPPQLHVCV